MSRRSLTDLAELPHLLSYASSGPAVSEAATEAAAMLESRVPSVGSSAAAAAETGSWAGPRVWVLFDDYDLVASPASSPLYPLLDLLPLGRDIGLHVVLARRVGGSARSAYETVFQRVRELGSVGLIMGGEASEGPLVGGYKAEPRPPGRGLLVRRGRPAVVVQAANAAPAPVAAGEQRSRVPGNGAVGRVPAA